MNLKVKKLSKSKKPIVIFIYGPIAAGKLTVAKILSKKFGFKLAHNHHINDFVAEIFERNSYGSHAMNDQLRYMLMEQMTKAGMSFVATHCYAYNFISKAGLSDPAYVKTLVKKLTKIGAEFYPVHLKASDVELLRRVSMNSRKAFLKLTDKKIMEEWISKNDWQTSLKLKNNLVIDNTNISPQKAADIIIKHFKIKQ